MNISFENKVALVTGAASGLGLATAKAFAEVGRRRCSCRLERKSRANRGCRAWLPRAKALAIPCDVSDDAQVEAVGNCKTVAAFGRLDVAYNNAGVQNVLAELPTRPAQDYERVMRINLRGVWN